MSIELMKRALEFITGVYFGEHEGSRADREKLEADLTTAIQQAEAQPPVTGEPVGFTYQAEIEYADSTGGNGSFWRVPPDLDDEAVPLYTHPAPSVRAGVVRDAERYRWLRNLDHWPAPFSSSQEPEPIRGSDLDAAIDAAMLAAKEAK